MSEPEELGSMFIRNYSSLLAAVWGNEAEAAKLAGNPTAYASAKGLPVDPGAEQLKRSGNRQAAGHQQEVLETVHVTSPPRGQNRETASRGAAPTGPGPGPARPP